MINRSDGMSGRMISADVMKWRSTDWRSVQIEKIGVFKKGVEISVYWLNTFEYATPTCWKLSLGKRKPDRDGNMDVSHRDRNFRVWIDGNAKTNRTDENRSKRIGVWLEEKTVIRHEWYTIRHVSWIFTTIDEIWKTIRPYIKLIGIRTIRRRRHKELSVYSDTKDDFVKWTRSEF